MGLFRHYWVVAKFAIAILATLLLLLHTQPISVMADAAAAAPLSAGDLRRLRIQLVADAAAALIALLTATTLSVYKPRGLTPFGRRKLQRQAVAAAPPWVYAAGIVVFSLIVVFVLLHLAGGGLHAH